jgi:hypothetical protein
MSSLLMFNRVYAAYTYTVCKGGVWGGSLRQIKHLPQSPFTGQFFKIIFLRCLHFRGLAKRTRYGDSCLAWDTPEIGFWFDSEQIRGLGPLTKDNRYCRNPDEAEAPWCLVGI